MGFWNFMRDMLVFDWLFGHHKKKSFGEQHQRENQTYADQSHEDYTVGYNHHDYAQQDFEDDPVSGTFHDEDFEDDLDSGMFDDDF